MVVYGPQIRRRVIDLSEQGLSVNEIARRLKGLLDRDTIKRWIKEFKAGNS